MKLLLDFKWNNILKKDTVYLFCILLTAVLYRSFLMRYRFTVSWDEVNYLKLAVDSALNGTDKVLHTYWSPLYPAVVGIFLKFCTHYEFIARFVSILFGSIVIWPIFHFSKKLFGIKSALFASIILAFDPVLAMVSVSVQTETLYTFLIVLGVLTGGYALERKTWAYSLISGVLFGLAYLTRPEGIGFLIVFTFILGVMIVQKVNWDKKGRFIRVLIIVYAGFFITALPYIIFLYQKTGELTISAKGKSIQQGEAILHTQNQEDGEVYNLLNKDNTQLLHDQMFHQGTFLQAEQGRGKPIIKITPKLLVSKYIKNVFKILKEELPKLFSTIPMLLFALGLFGSAWSKKEWDQTKYLFSYILFFWFIVIPAFHINERYFLPFLPFCYIWIGRGLLMFMSWMIQTIRNVFPKMFTIINERRFQILISVSVLILIVLPGLGRIIIHGPYERDFWADPIEQKIAGEWIKGQSSGTPVIMSYNHAVDFYAGNYQIKKTVTVPQNEWNRVYEYAKYRDVDYLVLNERYLSKYPKLLSLFKEQNIPPELEKVFIWDDIPGLKTVVYKVLDL